jgi:hypothetical protein
MRNSVSHLLILFIGAIMNNLEEIVKSTKNSKVFAELMTIVKNLENKRYQLDEITAELKRFENQISTQSISASETHHIKLSIQNRKYKQSRLAAEVQSLKDKYSDVDKNLWNEVIKKHGAAVNNQSDLINLRHIVNLSLIHI